MDTDSKVITAGALIGALFLLLVFVGGMRSDKLQHDCRIAAMQVYLDSAHVNQICGN